MLAPAVLAAPGPPAALYVSDGDHWRPGGEFYLRWKNPPASPSLSAVHYTVRDPLGATVRGPSRIPSPVDFLGIDLHGRPAGAHTIEVWLEDSTGAQGPPADAVLRYDPVAPGHSAPVEPHDWLSRTELPHAIRLTHPPAPHPVSGIRGYAVALDRNPEGDPCASARVCVDAETDLRTGIEGDTLVVDELPEGASQVHSVAVSGAGVRSATVGHAILRIDKVDPVTRLDGPPTDWTNRAVRLVATSADAASGMAGEGAMTAIRIDDGAPIVAAGDSVSATVIEEGAHTVAYYARDAAGNIDDGRRSNGQANHEPRTATIRIDREPPRVYFVGARYPADPELIEAGVADSLSGGATGRGEIAVRAVASGDPFLPLPTVAGPSFLRARWNSDEYPLGVYEFRATGYDAAGNPGVATTRANGSGMLLPNPLKARISLAAGLGPADRASPSRVVGFGRAVLLTGSLSSASDGAVAAETVRVVERFDHGAGPAVRTTAVHTGEDGTFQLRLEPGPSREVVAIHDGSRATTRAASERLRIAVRAGVTLRASAPTARIGGRPIVFSGAVASDPGTMPAGGIAVELQFRAPGVPWTEFRTVRANRRGVCRHAYRFSDDDSRGVRFQFRARVPAQPGWPYETGASRPVAVRGR